MESVSYYMELQEKILIVGFSMHRNSSGRFVNG